MKEDIVVPRFNSTFKQFDDSHPNLSIVGTESDPVIGADCYGNRFSSIQFAQEIKHKERPGDFIRVGGVYKLYGKYSTDIEVLSNENRIYHTINEVVQAELKIEAQINNVDFEKVYNICAENCSIMGLDKHDIDLPIEIFREVNSEKKTTLTQMASAFHLLEENLITNHPELWRKKQQEKILKENEILNNRLKKKRAAESKRKKKDKGIPIDFQEQQLSIEDIDTEMDLITDPVKNDESTTFESFVNKL